MPTETDRAYLAGLLDGEGHIGITLAKPRVGREWRTHALMVTLANVNIPVLEWARSIAPKGTLVLRQQPTGTQKIGNVRWSSIAGANLLRTVLPYLRIKRQQAILGLQFADALANRAHPTKFISEEEWYRREELRLAIRQINRPDPTLMAHPFPIIDRRRVCVVCGTEFEREPGSNRVVCSAECKSKRGWQIQKSKLRAKDEELAQLRALATSIAPTTTD